MSGPKYHKFDAVAWAFIEQMFAHLNVITHVERTHGMRKYGLSNPRPTGVFIRIRTTSYVNSYAIKRYHILDTDLRKYARLLYLYYISHPDMHLEKLDRMFKDLKDTAEDA